MENVPVVQKLVIHINGLSSMTLNEYQNSIEKFSSQYQNTYETFLTGPDSYLSLIFYFLVLIIAILCSGFMLFHFCVIIFSRIYLYRYTTPDLGTARKSPSFHDQPCSTKTSEALNSTRLNTNVPGVSIIKPLTGVDDAVIANLKSFFHLDYPKYELLFCVADRNDPVVLYVQDLINQYQSQVDATLIISDANDVCVNPKINNMNPAYVRSKYELVLISDVGIYMYQNTLSDMVITMLSEENVGLVHQVPFLLPYRMSQNLLLYDQAQVPNKCSNVSRPQVSWIHQLVYFGCWHAKMYMGAAMLGINCTTGMSCMMRKDILDAAGGLSHFGQYLAEDFFLSKHFYDSGCKVRVASQPAWQHAIVPSIKQFQERMLRWCQLRIAMVPIASVLELFSGCFINGALHSLCYYYIFPHFISAPAFFAMHVLVSFILDYVMLHQIHPPGTSTSISKLSFLIMWLLYESTAIFTQIRAFFTRTIKWRGKEYRLEWGGKAQRIDHRKESTIAYDDLEASKLISLDNNETMPLHSTFESNFSSESPEISMTKDALSHSTNNMYLSPKTIEALSPVLDKVSITLPPALTSSEYPSKTPESPCALQ